MSTPLGAGGAAVARVPILPFAARSSPRRISVPNDGLVCFLYDSANAEVIRRSAPALLEGFEPQVAMEDPALRDLALRGALVAYELYRDDNLSIDLSVGPLPSASDMRSGQWLAPQAGYIDIPSGVLRIDSYCSLPFGSRIPSARGAAFDVPPGRYILTLLRFDWYGRRMFSDLFDAPASEVIRLTPVGMVRLPSRPRAMLLYPERPVAVWEGAWEVNGGEFRGQLVGEVGSLKSIALNMDRDAAARIGLQPGTRMYVRAGEHRYDALYAGDIRIDEIVEHYGGYTLNELRAAAPFFAYMDHWQRPRRRLPSTVVVLSGGPMGEYDFSGLREGSEVTVSVSADRLEPMRWSAATLPR